MATGDVNYDYFNRAISTGGTLAGYVPGSINPDVYLSQLSLKWRARRSLDALSASTRNPRIACIGDSTVRGLNNTEQATTRTAMNLYGWPYLLAKYLTNSGVQASNDSLFGMGGQNFSSASILIADTRLTRSGSGFIGADTSLGGQAFYGSAVGSLTFTPQNSVDTIDLYYSRNTGYGTFTYAIDGGVPVLINANGAAAVIKVAVPCGSLGAHSITLAWVSGAVYLYDTLMVMTVPVTQGKYRYTTGESVDLRQQA